MGMNQFKQNGWTIQWEGEHEEYSKENKFIIIDQEMDQTMVKLEFNEAVVKIKPGMVDNVEIDAENRIITVIAYQDMDEFID